MPAMVVLFIVFMAAYSMSWIWQTRKRESKEDITAEFCIAILAFVVLFITGYYFWN